RLERLAYCTALRDREGDSSSQADQQSYIAALAAHTPQLEVLYGKYAPRTKTGVVTDKPRRGRPPRRVSSPVRDRIPEWLPVEQVIGPQGGDELLVTVSTFEEKGSDVNVASALLVDVLTARVDAAMVMSNDSGLHYPLQIAREHVPVATVNPSANPTVKDLMGKPHVGAGRHWWRRLRAEDFFAHQLEELFSQDAVVTLDLPVVPWRVWGDALVSAIADRVGEGGRAVAGAVVGHDPLELRDAVGREPCSRPVEESDCGHGFLVGQCLGVSEPRVAVDRRVQEDIAGLHAACLRSSYGLGFGAVLAVCAPAAAVGNASGLLHVDVHHVTGALGDDLLRLPVGFAVRVDELPAVQAELREQPCDRATADRGSILMQLERDSRGRPLVLAPHCLDPLDELARSRS